MRLPDSIRRRNEKKRAGLSTCLSVEQLEQRMLLAGVTGFPTDEFGQPPDPRMSEAYWDALQLARSGRGSEIPGPAAISVNPQNPGYTVDVAKYDQDLGLRTELEFLGISAELMNGLSRDGVVIKNTYSPPIGPTADNPFSWSRIDCWIAPDKVDAIMQISGLEQIDFPEAITANSVSPSAPDTSGAGVSSAQLSVQKPSPIDSAVPVAIQAVKDAIAKGSFAPGALSFSFTGASLMNVPVSVSVAGDVLVDVTYSPGNNALVDGLRSEGVVLGRSFPQYGLTEVWVNSGTLPELSRLDGVWGVSLPLPMTSQVGSWLSEGAGDAGSLSTRTSDTSGVVTVSLINGITTANPIDIFWSGGRRLGVTVTSVFTTTSTAVTFSGGTGDILPTSGTSVTVDSTLKVQRVLDRFLAQGIDGTGIKIGVMSTGDAKLTDAQSSGDLPAGVVVRNAGKTSLAEGTAMMEIIHDIAPGAQLYFYGVQTVADYLNGVTDLEGQGVKLVVDDLVSFDEPDFVDGSIALAVQGALTYGTGGIRWVTSAGNYNTTHYQAQAAIGASGRQNFNVGGATDETLSVSIPAGTPTNPFTFDAYLQWSSAWGSNTDNFGLYLLDSSGTVLTSQTGTSTTPKQHLTFQNTGVATTWQLRVTGATGINRKLEIFVAGAGGTSGAFGFNESYSPTFAGDALISQEAVPGVLAVAAVNANNANNSTIAPYSSHRPSTILTNASTQSFTTRSSLGVTGIDGVDTLAGHSLPAPPDIGAQFYGTSAAAPGIAAIEALMLQAAGANSGTWTMPNIIENNATDLGSSGYDSTYGYGRAAALEAVYEVYRPTAPDLDALSDNGYSSSDNVTTLTSLTFKGTGPLGSNVGIFDNGSGSPLATADVDASGNYAIAVTVSANVANNITARVRSSGSSTNWSDYSPSLPVYVDQLSTTSFYPLPPPVAAASDTGSSNSDGYTTVTNPNFSGTALLPSGSVAANAYVEAYVDGVFKTQVQANGSGVYSFNAGTLSYGWHTIAVRTKLFNSAPDAAYNQSFPARKIYIDNGAAPTPTSFTQIATPGTSPAGAVTITFDRPVSGISTSNFSITLNGGSNRVTLAAYPSLTTTDASWTLGNITDVTMAQGTYQATLASLTGIVSAGAGTAATGSVAAMGWTQGGSVPKRTATVTSSSTTVSSLSVSTSDLKVGMAVNGAGIPAGAMVASIVNSTTITISSAATASATGTLLVFMVPARTGNLTSGSTTVSSLSTTSDLSVGMPLNGVGIPFGTTVASIVNSTTITISTGATASGTAVQLGFDNNDAFENPLRYYDTNGDAVIAPADALQVINALNAFGGGALPSASYPNAATSGFIDTNGDSVLSAVDALNVINYLNSNGGVYNGHPPGFAPIGGGSRPPPDLTPEQVTATVQLQVVDLSGSPITSIKVGQQFQLQAILILAAPTGVQPFAGYADVNYAAALVTPATNSSDVGLAGSTVSGGLIDEAGRAVYGDSSDVIFSKTFTATKKGTTTFTSNAGDLVGHEIYVTGLNSALPWSQVTFTSTTLTIKP